VVEDTHNETTKISQDFKVADLGLLATVVGNLQIERPELVAGTRAQPESALGFIGYGLLVSAGLALFVAPFACGSPDGLETMARRLGFAGKALPPVLDSPLADYRLPFIGSPTRATALAGLIGTVLAFVAAYVLACMVVPVLAGSRKDAKR